MALLRACSPLGMANSFGVCDFFKDFNLTFKLTCGNSQSLKRGAGSRTAFWDLAAEITPHGC